MVRLVARSRWNALTALTILWALLAIPANQAQIFRGEYSLEGPGTLLTLPVGGNVTFTMAAHRECPPGTAVLPAETLRLKFNLPRGLAMENLTRLEFAEQVCVTEPTMSRNRTYLLEALATASAGNKTIVVEAGPEPGPGTAAAPPSDGSTTMTVIVTPGPLPQAESSSTAAPALGYLSLLVALACAALRRNR